VPPILLACGQRSTCWPWSSGIAAADSLLRRSTRLADAEVVRLPHGFGVGVSHPSLRLGLVDVLLDEQHPEEAWEECQIWSGWVTDAMLASVASRNASASSDSSTDAARLADRLRRLDAMLLLPASVESRPDGAFMDLVAERARVEAALIDRRARAATAATPTARPRILPSLQRALAGDEAVIGWIQANWDDDARRGGRHTVWAYVVRRTGPVRWIQLGRWDRERGSQAWFQDLDLFERRLEAAADWGLRVPADPGLDALGANVYRKLFAPLLPELTGVHRILAVYQVLNHWIPLECLAGPDGRALAERFEVAYVPSAWALVQLRARPARGSSADFHALVVGDPDYSGRAREGASDAGPTTDWTKVSTSVLQPTVVRSVLTGQRSVAELPPLPQSLAEARDVAAHLPGSLLLTGASASGAKLEALRRDGRMSEFSVLHFATHALVDDAIPERSAIALAPSGPGGSRSDPDAASGLLRADEVLARWRLRAGLVVLSSCQTAGGRFTWSAQSLGLAQSFLAAGARSLLLSPWKVDDLATRALMDEFSSRLGGSLAGSSHALRPGEALREARLAIRDFRAPDGSRPFAHPAYWAAFILVGDPGASAASPLDGPGPPVPTR
jgi:CHAT domain-containing protein